ncbi:MAG: 3-deoxy-7-phosphoheptulonate synthase [Candidatus Raymondbacteria bacterium RifOxyA12_full_50_37]|uniref:3-deoxy-7-phosphoheptulonate synthase n=1 Tax=Candidatus Raymondbacteria bacterium RIFOXYD12_FULL_49_13 TaxID=1817890 RepID=A0A1F7F492_UNCRA|nr:MAG: 3-deoxy-7-phosphoheptulonate synthase [Candidatus Raymondbacteria bacterium RifOxyA12_full_50_37]OGJ86232.1 MAG: 3-deoxy-7-phosphoheptulonate synthase [Candidatus Raymondbacteria bacterium RIFOXYA2_FULL_49_16]OGJ95771.1 MAG: 3-deoxy-7-phosphoheptulonate synthase [Candidatus Raymondbacteria bacterium RIFOXYC2_FULL_50_21]OGK01469.1 MAG: 3-deoxy-7-phosphoheptulonate synthase [Candidatus Raymondbacteria bacterium RIFOXYD12_FULL_49_13]OGK03461.1 MAG: 3-deoxy-7-phosphoheptulonate synthase [Ca
MIIVMKPGASREHIDRVMEKIQGFGYKPHPIFGTDKTVIGAIGDERGKARLESLLTCDGVENVVRILKPFKLASREFHPAPTVLNLGGVRIGEGSFTVMAGPCSVESEEQLLAIAHEVKKAGATILRGGAFKPRTSPYAFRGMEEDGLKLLALARQETGLKIVTEVMNPRDIDICMKYADMLQIGARNVQNFSLLTEVGRAKAPVLLKRGMATTIEELIMSAEYIMAEGNMEVVLCERGIRTFETATRNTFDISAVPVLKKLSHLPVITDPSHATGIWDLVAPMAKASLVAGADGIIVEVHNKPEEAFSDGPQSLKPATFAALMQELRKLAEIENKSM